MVRKALGVACLLLLLGCSNYVLQSRSDVSFPVGDFNGDCLVDEADEQFVLDIWGKLPEEYSEMSFGYQPEGQIDQQEFDLSRFNRGKTCNDP